MSTSLAEQLQRLARPQTTALDRGKKRASLLFDPKEAAGLSKETVYDIGIAGIEELILKNSIFEQFSETLFSYPSRDFERSIQTAEVNKKLDKHIRKFLLLLSPYFMINSTYKALEWLIYRYSIHEYNREDLLMLVFPYHETNIFTRVIQLIKIRDEKDEWFFLKPLQKSGVHLAKTTLLNHAVSDPYFIKFVSNFILELIKVHSKHNLLMVAFNFYCSVLTGAIEYAQKVTEPIITQMLPSLLKGTNSEIADFRAATYVIIARLVTKCVLSDLILDKFIQRISNHKIDSLKEEAVLVYVVIYQSQVEYNKLPEGAVSNIAAQPWLPGILQELNAGGCHIHPFLQVLIPSLVAKGADEENGENCRKFLIDLLNTLKIDQENVPSCLNSVLEALPTKFKKKPDGIKQWFSEIVEIFEKQYPESFDKEIHKILSTSSNEPLKKTVKKVLKNASTLQGKFDIFDKLYHANSAIRANALEFISEHFQELHENEKDLLKISLEDRLRDEDVSVVKETLTILEKSPELLNREKLTECLDELLNKYYRNNKKWGSLLEKILQLLCVEENGSNFKVILSIFPMLLPRILPKNSRNSAEIQLAKMVINSRFFEACPLFKNFNRNARLENIGDFPSELFQSLKRFENWEIMRDFLEQIGENATPLQIYISSLILANVVPQNSSPAQVLPFLKKLNGLYENCDDRSENRANCILDNLKIAKSGQLPTSGFLETIIELISKVQRIENIDFSHENAGEFLVSSCNIFYHCGKNYKQFFKKFNDFIAGKEIQKKIEFMLHFQIYKNTFENTFRVLKLVQREFESCENTREFLEVEKNFVPFILILLNSPSENIRKRTIEMAETVLKHCKNCKGATYKPLVEFLLAHKEEILLDHTQIKVIISNFSLEEESKNITEKLIELVRSPKIPNYLSSELIEILSGLNSMETFEKLSQIPIEILEKNSENYDKFESKIVLKMIEKFDENTHTAELVVNSNISKLLFIILSTDKPCLEIQNEKKSPCLIFLETIGPNFISSLSTEVESKILDKMVEISTITNDPKIVLASNKLFKKITVNIEQLIPQLVRMKDVTIQRDDQKKRRTISMVPTVEILETLEWKKGVRVLELIQNKKKLMNLDKIVKLLFDILKKCLDFDEQSPLEYPKQLLLSGILNFCKKIQDDVKLPESTYNVELIVQCIRATPNPQTHYHALLVLAYLAEVIPTQVLHHIMAIFTFMGSSVLRHDDSYSSQLITKIVDTIIPIITENREIISVLRVFVTALLDVPEHRRKFLYVQLLTLLRPQEHVHEFLILLFINHVIQSEREKSKSNRSLEIAAEIVMEFDPDVIFTGCVKLIQYLRKLPIEFESLDKTSEEFEIINEISSPKQFRHFKYTLVIFVNNYLISSRKFVEKIAELSEDQLEKLQIHFKDLIVNTLQYIQSTNPILDKFLNTNANQAQYWKAIQHQSLEILDGINALLTPDMFILVIKGLMTHNLVTIKKRALDLLNSKLQLPTFVQDCQKEQLDSLIHPLLNLLENIKDAKPEEFVVIQTGLLSVKLIVKTIANENPENYVSVLEFIGETIKTKSGDIDSNVLASLILCLAELCVTLRARAIQCVPNFMPSLLKILKQQKYQDSPTLLCLSLLTVILRILESLSQFLSPYLKKIICEICQLGCKWQDNSNDSKLTPFFQKLNQIKSKLGECVAPRILIPTIEECYEELSEKDKLEAVIPLMKILSGALNNLTGNDISSNLTELTRFFIVSLDFRNQKKVESDLELTNRIENQIIEAFSSMVLKLSETSFRPLFYKIFDWATRSEENERIITFYNISSCLSKHLKSLFVLFAGHFIGNAAKTLDSINTLKCTKQAFEDDGKNLFLLEKILDTLHNIFQYCTTKFINKERFEILMQPIVDQLENGLGHEEIKEVRIREILTPCIVQFAVATSDDSLWKQMNYQILLKLRNGDPKIRQLALNCLTELVKKLGDDFLPLLPETIPFLSELLEDEEEIVEKSCQKSIQEMEKVLGENLQKYF